MTNWMMHISTAKFTVLLATGHLAIVRTFHLPSPQPHLLLGVGVLDVLDTSSSGVLLRRWLRLQATNNSGNQTQQAPQALVSHN